MLATWPSSLASTTRHCRCVVSIRPAASSELLPRHTPERTTFRLDTSGPQRRPAPPVSLASPDVLMMSPPLRQSQSFSTADTRSHEKPPTRAGDAPTLSAKRYSDETRDSKNAALKKKSGFSGFVNSLVGSP